MFADRRSKEKLSTADLKKQKEQQKHKLHNENLLLRNFQKELNLVLSEYGLGPEEDISRL